MLASEVTHHNDIVLKSSDFRLLILQLHSISVYYVQVIKNKNKLFSVTENTVLDLFFFK